MENYKRFKMVGGHLELRGEALKNTILASRVKTYGRGHQLALMKEEAVLFEEGLALLKARERNSFLAKKSQKRVNNPPSLFDGLAEGGNEVSIPAACYSRDPSVLHLGCIPAGHSLQFSVRKGNDVSFARKRIDLNRGEISKEIGQTTEASASPPALCRKIEKQISLGEDSEKMKPDDFSNDFDMHAEVFGAVPPVSSNGTDQNSDTAKVEHCDTPLNADYGLLLTTQYFLKESTMVEVQSSGSQAESVSSVTETQLNNLKEGADKANIKQDFSPKTSFNVEDVKAAFDLLIRHFEKAKLEEHETPPVDYQRFRAELIKLSQYVTAENLRKLEVDETEALKEKEEK